ncbi:glycosyltransferase family 39 protein [Archangium lansingense]|uniref:Glycosyltransferase family 39 protein n=1 Tax=Archangium lansingense TaxID=2995310 RepID=A0ABT4A0D7_9BACT|nr:glycosyltransferase family 39 protein [Archangium lansinium]MCY1075110.1 glycosyltransferase family 39 protein [Archangium lansinium]
MKPSSPLKPAWERRIAIVGAVLAVAVVALKRGRQHPDEVFQFLEPAHGLAFGYWIMAWEWVEGLRNWAVPGVLGGILALCRGMGIEHAWALASVVWACCAAVQAWGTLALFRLVEERDGREAALLAAAVHVTWGGWLLYAARPLADSLSVAPLLGALLWAWRARARDDLRAGFWSGVLLGLAFVVRYPSAVFGVPIAVSLLVARRWRSLAGGALGVGVVLLGLGLLDWLTWGAPWHTLWKYFEFNILTGGSVKFGTKPWWWYLPTLAGMVPLLLVWHFGRGLARRDLLAGSFVFYLGVMSLLAHKEIRFLAPLLPLFVVLAAGPAWRTLSQRVSSRRVLGGLVGVYALSSLAAATVVMPGGLATEQIDALVFAGRDPSLTGLIVAGQQEWNVSGRFYLRRDVPLLVRPKPLVRELDGALTEAQFSHVLVNGSALGEQQVAAAGFCVLRRWGPVVLWRRCPSANGSGELLTSPSGR